jgi:hypothetical protein
MRTYVRFVLVVFAAFELVLGFAVLPLVFHLGHLEGGETGWSIGLAVVLALSVLVPASALAAVRDWAPYER